MFGFLEAALVGVGVGAPGEAMALVVGVVVAEMGLPVAEVGEGF